jgi:hypothetical protein
MCPVLRNAVLAFLLAVTPVVAAEREKVDLELVIANDASYSIDEEEARLQREGVAAAFLAHDVVQAIRSGLRGRIAVAYIDYASTPYNEIVVDWTLIHDQASAAAFAKAILSRPSGSGRHTSISSALEMGTRMIAENAYDGTRRTIDISGDGPNNFERRVDVVRDEVVARGITINGLPIMNLRDAGRSRYYLPDLDKYFEGCVIGGRGAFVVVAHDFKDFARAMKKKLVLEISGLSVASPVRKAQYSLSNYPKGCDIGERMRGLPYSFDDP